MFSVSYPNEELSLWTIGLFYGQAVTILNKVSWVFLSTHFE